MAFNIEEVRFWCRRDTAANWTSVNPVLSSGEWGVETDNTGSTPRKFKMGDGVTAWNSLPYSHPGAFVEDAIADGVTTKAPSQNAVYDALALKADASTVSGLVLDSIADSDTTHAPSRNAVYDALVLKMDKAGGTFTGDVSVPDEAYDATTWNGSLEVPTKNAIRDKIESLAISADWTTIVKSADESRNSTTTLADDSTLTVALAAGTTYILDIEVWLNTANATMDYKFQFNYTGTITLQANRQTFTNAGTPDVDAINNNRINLGGSVTAGTFGLTRITLKGIITTNSSGTLSFQWAQNTSDGGAIIVRKGSYLRYRQV